MKILLWHGYLLSGSGSNIYTRNIATHWRHAGHDVLCMCQERNVYDFDVIDEHADLAPDNRSFERKPTGVVPDEGRCAVVRAAIGDVIPVYVYDRYEGFTAKRFVDLSDAELEGYIERNVTAMITVIEEFAPEAIITGHEIMGPYIAKLACESTGRSFIAKLHGSALEYAVKEQPDRFLTYAIEGLSAARAVTGGSRYMIEAAASFIPGWRERAHVVNPGADVELFRPVRRGPPSVPTVGFVGKLLANKGVHNLLGACPFIDRDLAVVIVGFGDYDDALRTIADLLRAGDRDGLAGFLRAHPDERLGAFESIVSAADTGYFDRARRLDIRFTGRLEHGPLAPVLATFDVLVAPSILAEAFGMVAVEAAASGVLPVVPDHSGIGEVGRALEAHLDLEGMLVYDASDPIVGIATRIRNLLAIPFERRTELGAAASALAHERWSWKRCADELLALASGS